MTQQQVHTPVIRRAVRRQVLRVLESFAPHVVLVDTWPLGKRRFHFDTEPLVDQVHFIC